MPFFLFVRFFVRRSITSGSRIRSFVRGGERVFHTRGMIVLPSGYGKGPMRQFQSTPIAVFGSGHTERISTH